MVSPIRKSDFAPGSLYVDVPQTGVAVRRMQTDDRFLAMKMVPRCVVKKPTGLYTVVNMADLNRDEMDVRGPSSQAQSAAWSYSTAPYSTDARSLKYDANDAAIAASDVERNPDIIIPRVLAYKAMIHLEKRVSDTFFKSSAWYRTVTGAGSDSGTEGTTTMNREYWSDSAADPIDAITEEIRIQSKLTGQKPQGMALGSKVAQKLRNHPKVKAQITSTIASGLTLGMPRPAQLDELAKLLGLQWVGVSEAIYNTALEGEAATNSYIIPETDALLFYSESAGQEGDAMMTVESDTPSAFARFVWDALAGGEGVQIRKFRDERIGPGGSTTSVIDVYNGFGVITKECGTYFSGIVQ